MISGATVLALISAHGLWLLLPLAVLEGPIVTVIAAWLAQQGLFDLRAVYAVAVLGDLVGDALWYLLGRTLLGALPERLRGRLGLRPDRMERLTRRFGEKGGRTLLFGKLTHAAGLPILVAAGAARMNLAAYLGYNLLGTLPKSAALVALGWGFGSAWERIGTGFSCAALGVGLLILSARAVHRLWQKRAPA